MIDTHQEASEIVDLFEQLLDMYNIKVPSPDDDDRGEDSCALYGTVYGDLVDGVAAVLESMLDECVEVCAKNAANNIYDAVVGGSVYE